MLLKRLEISKKGENYQLKKHRIFAIESITDGKEKNIK